MKLFLYLLSIVENKKKLFIKYSGEQRNLFLCKRIWKTVLKEEGFFFPIIWLENRHFINRNMGAVIKRRKKEQINPLPQRYFAQCVDMTKSRGLPTLE